ncbi:MAG: hypothetical protein U1E78_05860 [Gammaproteobacteria bacterium]
MFWIIVGATWAKAPYIPEVLKPWQEWVLWDHEAEVYCPVIQDKETHDCVWPGKLKLNIQGQVGTFSLSVQVFFDSWVRLPGDASGMPFDVKVNDKLAPVMMLDSPAIFLNAGVHQINGQLHWQAVPSDLTIPRDIGLLDLSIDGQVIAQPDRDPSGKVWLKGRYVKEQKVEDSLSVQVFRYLKDDNPFIDRTIIKMKVSGQDREVVLSGPLLPDFIPISFASNLPARLEPDGRLRVQVRAGSEWEMTLNSRHIKPVSVLNYIERPAPWPEKEIWTFEPVPALRLVEVKGGQPLDPTQTDLPETTNQFQAFLMTQDQKLDFEEKRRGQATERADQLQLTRTMWLDFEGRGFTLQDNLSGQLEQDWRLEVSPQMQLGRVQVDGEDRLITKGPKGQSGVEVRQGQLNVMGIGEMKRQGQSFSAVGWDRDVQYLSTLLQLPPGWHLFAATGVDQVDSAWIDKWNLLDLFLVLVIAAAVLKLFNFRWGVVALITLVLIYHERGAPIYSWLNLLAGIGLLRVMSPGKMRVVVEWYYRLSVLLIAFHLIPFAVDQVRQGMYPQLARPSYTQPVYAEPQVMSIGQAPKMMRQRMEAGAEALSAREWSSADSMANEQEGAVFPERKKALDDYDPNAKIQTGPGIPNWTWQTVNLIWNGPVMKDQMMRLWLIPPTVSSILNCLRVFMIGCLAWILLQSWRDQTKTPQVLASWGVALIGGFLALNLLTYSSKILADEIPDPVILEALQARLLAPPDCVPHCSGVGKMWIQATSTQLKIRMDVNALSQIAIPIPSALGKWSPQVVTLNGQVKTGLMTKDQVLHLALEPGAYSLELVGMMPELESFELPIPVLPTSIQVEADAWKVDGPVDGFLRTHNLYFKRIVAQGSTLEKLKPGEMPTFVSVTRRLELGFTWKVITEAQRLSPQRGSVSVKIPLLSGERVLNDSIKVKDSEANIVFSDFQNVVSFESELPIVPSLALKAADQVDFTETWALEASGIWHVEFEGISPIHQRLADGRWQPTWRPWPDEAITLNITRPEGLAGATMSIDSSAMSMTPGKRAMDVELNFNVRASQGGTHVLKLPQDIKLQDVLINGQSQSINLQGQALSVPIYPGGEAVQIKWQMPFELNSLFKTPTVDLNAKSSNAVVNVTFGKDRWILAMGGPSMGPVVLFWGVLIVVLVVAYVLSRLTIAPLNFWQWSLLGVGVAVASPIAAVGVLAWFFAMGRCAVWKPQFKSWGYTVLQVGLVFLTFIFIISLLTSISKGLLGTPQMQLAAPMSGLIYNSYFGPDHHYLSWYQDLSTNSTPKAWVLTLSVYWYRGLMLLWALWLAFSMMHWFKWGWQSFSRGGLWVPAKL